jgi:soluble lytic murein transglycosylase
MGARALVTFILVLLTSQPMPLVGAQSLDEALVQGRQLTRRGDYAAAQQYYLAVAEQFGPSGAPRALLLRARAALLAGDADAAEATVQSVLNDYPGSDQQAGALFTLARLRRTAGDCSGALGALAAYDSAPGRRALGPYLALQRAACLARVDDWPGELAAAREALSIDGGGPRLTRIEGLERAGEAALNLGRKQDALNYYNTSLSLAGTRAYRAEMLFTTATISHAMGVDDVDRFRAIVVELAETARAPGALDALVEMGQGGVVSPYQAGTVRLNARDYSAALDLFNQVPAGTEDAGAAGLGSAAALIKLGREDDARIELAALADNEPSVAGRALLQLGQLQMRAGEFSKAENTFARMATLAPERAAEALLYSGFTRYVRHDTAAALDAWRRGLAIDSPPQIQSQLQFWLGKVLPPGSAEALDALNQALALAPDTYHGLRARELLAGSILSTTNTAARAVAGNTLGAASARTDWRVLSSAELAERDAWLTTQGTSLERVRADMAALPALRRADDLLEIGLTTEAGWEVDGVVQSYAATKDVAHLSAVADWLTERDLPQLTLRVGKLERDLVGLSALPRAVQKQVYPDGWGDLVVEQSARHGVDPLLMLAIMRQESSFDPRAQSGAQAMGLTQVVPPTARTIAARLGYADFVLGDLFKPAVSLDFGAWYMATLLQEFDHRPFPALAAYNAGGGNVSRWLQRYGDDPDVLVELVPFAETQTYLRIVYDNYRHYQLLYGSLGQPN